MKPLTKAPKYILKEIDDGYLIPTEPDSLHKVDLSTSKTPQYCFHLYSHDDELLEDLLDRAYKIAGWFNKQMEGTAEIGVNGTAWYTYTTRYGTGHNEKMFMVLAVVDPYNKQIEDYISEHSISFPSYHVIEYPKLPNSKGRYDFTRNKKATYIRYYFSHDQWYGTNMMPHSPLTKSEWDEADQIINPIMSSMYSLYQLKDWLLKKAKADQLSDDEFELYTESENLYYSLRFIIRQGDYNIYFYIYRKENSNGKDDNIA